MSHDFDLAAATRIESSENECQRRGTYLSSHTNLQTTFSWQPRR